MGIAAIDTASVIGSIQLAAARTGVDFAYLLAEAKVESGLNPDAAAPTSSARGLFQFTRATWLDTVRRHGAEHGLGWAADALASGADAATRAAILDLRRDAGASATMAAALASDNRAALEQRLGKPATATDLYLAHFLGSAGAARFLAARAADPDAAASSAVLPGQVRANAAVFTARDGRVRSLGEVYAHFQARIGNTDIAFAPPSSAGNVLPRPGNPLPVAAPRAARAAYLLLAQLA